MPQVLPGDVTGLYYILVSNLPWSATWKDLKDFARKQDDLGNCLAIEHAEVYRKSTCGWVIVRGKEDFCKALQHLQGGMMEGRALCADGRNEKEPIAVRDLVSPSTSPYFSEGTSTRDTNQLAAPYHATPSVDRSSTTTSMSFNSKGQRVTQTQSVSKYPNISISPSSPAMKFIKSRVVLTRISRNGSTTDLRKFVEEVIRTELRNISFPENPLPPIHKMKIEEHPDGNRKSHAFINFETYDMAQAIVDILNGKKFMGKSLQAKLAKDGLGPRERSVDRNRQQERNKDRRRERDMEMEMEREREIERKREMERDRDRQKERNAERDRKKDMEKAMDIERAKAVRASAKAAVAAVAAEAKRSSSIKSLPVANGSGVPDKGAFMKSPMIANGSGVPVPVPYDTGGWSSI